jgi:hypothetical protein
MTLPYAVAAEPFQVLPTVVSTPGLSWPPTFVARLRTSCHSNERKKNEIGAATPRSTSLILSHSQVASSVIFRASHMIASWTKPGMYQWSTAACAARGTSAILADRSSIPLLICATTELNCASLKVTTTPAPGQ